MLNTVTKIDSKNNDYITTTNGEVYKKPSQWVAIGSTIADTVVGALAGGVTFSAIHKRGAVLNENIGLSYLQYAEKMHQDKGDVIWNAIEKMYSDNTDKFARKGIDWFNYDSEIEQISRYKVLSKKLGYDRKPRSLTEIFDEKLAKICKNYETTTKQNGISKILNKIQVWRLGKCLDNINKYNTAYPDKLTKIYYSNPELATKKASTKLSEILINIQNYDNALNSADNAYSIKGNAFVSKNSLFKYSLPHELGHSLNYKSKGLSKLWQTLYDIPEKNLLKTSKFSIPLLMPILLVASSRRKKVERDESTTPVGKSLDFVKNNCVGITAALYAPRLIDEANASIKGIKMMKPYLPKKEISLLKGLYGRAYLTYLVQAITVIGSIWGANTIKNLIDKSKKVEEKPAQEIAIKTQNIPPIDIDA